MSEKVSWTIHQNRDDTISIYRDGEFILAMDDRIENHRLILRFQRDLDRLAEVNKVLVVALEFYANGWAELEYKGRYDQGKKAYEAIAKAKEMGK